MGVVHCISFHFDFIAFKSYTFLHFLFIVVGMCSLCILHSTNLVRNAFKVTLMAYSTFPQTHCTISLPMELLCGFVLILCTLVGVTLIYGLLLIFTVTVWQATCNQFSSLWSNQSAFITVTHTVMNS